MKRKDALVYMRVAGYHGDSARYTRLLIENRVSHQAGLAEYRRGQAMKEAGVPCTCTTCNPPPKGN